jgi:hypothetical protein
MKYANISNDDLQFLRATRGKLSKPVNLTVTLGVFH